MNFDFTNKTFSVFLLKLLYEYKTFDKIENILTANNQTDKLVFLRHDVDKNPANALKVAKLEHEMGICGTYYFRTHSAVFKPEIIRQIADLGHEIGYHYEDFSNCHGNPEKAIVLFQKNLAKLREITPISTICMDGCPLSKYNNLDLWKYYNYKDYGIVAEPYLDIDFNKVLYLSDTGRGWNLIKYSIRDKVKNPFNYHDKSTAELIKDIVASKLPSQIMITIHPQRWHATFFPWIRELIVQNLKNQIKRLIISYKQIATKNHL